MHVFSSSSPSSANSSSKYGILSPQGSSPLKFNLTAIPFKPLYPSSPRHLPNHPISSLESSSPPLLEETTQKFPLRGSDNDAEAGFEVTERKIRTAKKSQEELLVVHRPIMEYYKEEEEEEEEEEQEGGGEGERSCNSVEDDGVEEEKPSSSSSPFDANLSKFARKMPMFEPQRVRSDN